MPIFEYVCRKCGKEFEQLVPNASTKPSCPVCGEKETAKKLSRFAAAVKESGGCPVAGVLPVRQKRRLRMRTRRMRTSSLRRP